MLLTGAEECLQEGMRSFVRAHRGDLDRESTYFVNLDTVGHGNVRYEAGEGLASSPIELDRRLVELCNAIATADREDSNRYQARPLIHGLAGDSMPPRIAGFPATAITCLNDLNYVPAATTPSTTLPTTSTRRRWTAPTALRWSSCGRSTATSARRSHPVI